jgi:dTDP-glucose 4,6-dehydratase
MRVVITGGAGFVGSHQCERLLAAGHQVVCLDNLLSGRAENLAAFSRQPGFHFDRMDVSERCDVAGPVDAVLHFASPASPVDYLRHPVATLRVGSRGTENALELARSKQARFLLASTSEVYGDPEVSPQPESYWGHVNPIGPRSVYDEAKRFAEAMTFAYRRSHAVDTRVVRIFNTYGPRMRPNDGRVVSNFIVQALTGEDLTVYGDGSQTRSLCYVSDLVSGILGVLGLAPGLPEAAGPINLGNPVEMTVEAIARLVLELTGGASRIVRRPLPEDDPKRRCPDIRRAQRLLGWTPQVAAREGLERTIAFFRAETATPTPAAVRPPAAAPATAESRA